jgi:hypothetical protein
MFKKYEYDGEKYTKKDCQNEEEAYWDRWFFSHQMAAPIRASIF